MQCSPDHVYQFFMSEMGTQGSTDGNQWLIICGKYIPKYIDHCYINILWSPCMWNVLFTKYGQQEGPRKAFLLPAIYYCGLSWSVALICSGYHSTSCAECHRACNAKGNVSSLQSRKDGICSMYCWEGWKICFCIDSLYSRKYYPTDKYIIKIHCIVLI
jgi:hypothetical protein